MHWSDRCFKIIARPGKVDRLALVLTALRPSPVGKRLEWCRVSDVVAADPRTIAKPTATLAITGRNAARVYKLLLIT
jgi:hypothetical protein